MAIWRHPELEALLGGPLDTDGVTAAGIGLLADESVPETNLLDFKASLWPSSKGQPRTAFSAEQELAKDVSALANAQGGVIVVGVREKQGVADSAPGFPMALTVEQEERRLRQAITQYVSPMMEVDFVWIEVDADSWYLVVVVPKSPRSPHAVLGQSGQERTALHYPLRHGTDTIWLAEPEVAERMARRFDSRRSADQAFSTKISTGIGSITASATGIWLFAAITPESPIEGRLDARTVKEIDGWYHKEGRATSPLSSSISAYGRGIAAPGRVMFTGSRRVATDNETEIRDALVDLYIDGSAFVATPIGLLTTGDGDDRRIGEISLVDSSALVIDQCLRWCSQRAPGSGLSNVVLGLIDADRDDGHIGEPVVLTSSDFGNTRQVRATRTVTGQVTGETVADMAAVSVMQQRLAIAYQATSRLLHWFGLSETNQLRPDGTLIANQFTGSHSDEVRRWAEIFDVDVD